jgi:hypothetical protein
MTFYQRKLPHWRPEGATIFVTWRPHGSLTACVVMSNHVHVLVEPFVSMARITQWIKGTTARQAAREIDCGLGTGQAEAYPTDKLKTCPTPGVRPRMWKLRTQARMPVPQPLMCTS